MRNEKFQSKQFFKEDLFLKVSFLTDWRINLCLPHIFEYLFKYSETLSVRRSMMLQGISDIKINFFISDSPDKVHLLFEFCRIFAFKVFFALVLQERKDGVDTGFLDLLLRNFIQRHHQPTCLIP